MKPSNIIDQARAKLIWGEPANAVREFLTSNGLSDIEAERKVAEFCAERNLDIRKIGIKKILIGGGLTFISSAHFSLPIKGRILAPVIDRLKEMRS